MPTLRSLFPVLAVLAQASAAAAACRPVSPYTGKPVPARPAVHAWPHHPGPAFPPSPARDAAKVCFVPSNATDASPAILAAFRACNGGGTVVLDGNYTLASPLDLTFLDAVDVALTGEVQFSTDMAYWQAHWFVYSYQDARAVWRFGGTDVNIYGNGTGLINGNGQVWYDAFAANSSLNRPVMFVFDGLNGGSMSGIHMMNPPMWFNLVANSSDLVVSDLTMSVQSTNSNPAKNTDGWDILRSSNLVIQNSNVNNNDDCLSFKPNSTNIVVQGLVCNGSHGISVGSLGQYVGEYDVAANLTIFNISMSDASDGARIKVWPGTYTDFQSTLSGGGGSGYVKNVTYDTFYVNNVDWAVELTQCYGQSNQTLCNEYPSNMTISDVVFKNFYGRTSTKHGSEVGTLVCSSPTACSNISASNITVQPASGNTNTNTTTLPEFVCTNMDNSLLAVDCVTA